MIHSRHTLLTGLALGAGGASLFSAKGVVMKLAFAEGASVELMMVLRMGFSLPVFVAVGVWAHRRRPVSPSLGHLVQAAGLGVLSYYVCTWLDFSGLQYISAQFERLILFLYPTLTALLAWAFLGDRITARHAAALALSYAGVALLFGQEWSAAGAQAALGAGLVFASAALFAVYVTASKAVITAMGAPLFTSVAMSAAALAILAHMGVLVALEGPPEVDRTILGFGVLLAIGCTVAPSFMMSEAISRIGPGLASAVGGFGPAATAAAAVLVLGEPFGVTQAAALALTVGGVLLLAGGAGRERKAAA